MAYSELIKSFKSIRSYMREFYIYGFKSRDEYDTKSARSYDNERRRIESWLGEYMSFHQDAAGKRMFISVDSRSIPHNPLYKAFRAKSFTRGDLLLHFYILDLLVEDVELSVHQIVEHIYSDYLTRFAGDYQPDDSTVRKKLQEYESLGLLVSRKQGRELCYRRRADCADISSWQDAVAFFAEAAPLGVVGSYLLDNIEHPPAYFSFKHHYMLHALDSEVLLTLLHYMTERRYVRLTITKRGSDNLRRHRVFPMKIYISTQTGRQYLLAHSPVQHRFAFFRLDSIAEAAPDEPAEETDSYDSKYRSFARHLWGVSAGAGRALEHIEMTVRVEDGEQYIVQRLEREKRCGTVEAVDRNTYRFAADVYDSTELLPWVRTFIGRIVGLSCSNTLFTDTFHADLLVMQAMYGGDDHALS